jgi:CheY-like chemotaxis protein
MLLGDNPASHVAASLEVLLYGMMCYPERVNPLTLRTLSQAVDFLSTLWEREMHLQPLDLQNSHVLIVEDEPSARDLIVAAMQMVGLNADGLETPGASLAVLSTQPFDLIFMDVNLPEMNGFEVCKKLRALSLHERTPVIFLTGMASFQNRVQSSLCGGNDFVGKPFNLAELGVKALIWLIRGRLGLS